MILETNDTLRFILPMLYTKDFNNDFFYNEYLIGSFMYDVNNPMLENKLLLVYQFFPEDDYVMFETCLQSHPNYAGQYEYEGQDVIVYVFNIPEQFKNDFILINSNRYSEISSLLKLNISKMWNLSSSDDLFQVITGEADYIGEPFDKQIFNIEEYDYNDLYDQLDQALNAEQSGIREGEEESVLVF